MSDEARKVAEQIVDDWVSGGEYHLADVSLDALANLASKIEAALDEAMASAETPDDTERFRAGFAAGAEAMRGAALVVITAGYIDRLVCRDQITVTSVRDVQRMIAERVRTLETPDGR